MPGGGESAAGVCAVGVSWSCWLLELLVDPVLSLLKLFTSLGRLGASKSVTMRVSYSHEIKVGSQPTVYIALLCDLPCC